MGTVWPRSGVFSQRATGVLYESCGNPKTSKFWCNVAVPQGPGVVPTDPGVYGVSVVVCSHRAVLPPGLGNCGLVGGIEGADALTSSLTLVGLHPGGKDEAPVLLLSRFQQ